MKVGAISVKPLRECRLLKQRAPLARAAENSNVAAIINKKNGDVKCVNQKKLTG